MKRFAAAILLVAIPIQISRAELAGINLAGDASFASSQTLTSPEATGFVPQKLWNNAGGANGQMKLESDPEGGIGIFYTDFIAQWSSVQTGSANVSAALPGQKMMKGSILGVAGKPAVVQIAGIPWNFTSKGYALLIYCDSPNNAADAVTSCTVDSGGITRTYFVRDPANTSYSGNFLRAPVTSTSDFGQQTPSGNVMVIPNLTAGDVAVALEPAGSTPSAIVGLNGIQIVPMDRVQTLVPRITSPATATVVVNTAFSYTIRADVAVDLYDAVGLPAGLSINWSNGQISGVLTAAGIYSVTLKASNSAGTATQLLTLSVQLPSSQPVSLDLCMVPGLLLQGELGRTYQIEAADAVTGAWDAIGTVTVTTQPQWYVDLSAPTAVKRFYRATVLP